MREATTTALETRTRILEAAEAAFAEAGFSGARLADIAGRVGMRRPSLLYHFPSKEVLYAATVEHSFDRLRKALVEAMTAREDFVGRLTSTVRSFARFLDERPTAASLLLRELLDYGSSGRVILFQQIAPLIDRVEAFIEQEGRAHLPEGFPVREAILQVASNILLRASAGGLRQPLWGSEDRCEQLVLSMFLRK